MICEIYCSSSSCMMACDNLFRVPARITNHEIDDGRHFYYDYRYISQYTAHT
ncbi:hypothetical protein PILCRDRAFT_644184 [Piloderma croceum F 1598]|uniref:Uncharacterized protein n=1 Tax=Piloderma croceum (strain F 1598) TaxID=765440 RepID=A0A0C3BGK3_PILCF|nr:hypothetical protein PILCRDRAFT_644184 [Piloderma croceum F 1598]